MGISRLDALVIQTNEIKCEAKGPYENGKFGMTTLMIRDGEVHREVVSCDYGHFESTELAVAYAEMLVMGIRKMGDKIWENDAVEKKGNSQ